MKKPILLLMIATVASWSASSSAFAGSETWNGGSGNWSDTTWSPDDAAPGALGTTNNGDTATFNTISAGTLTVDAGRNIKNITFDTNIGSFTLSGGNLVLSSGGTIQLASTVASTGATENINTGMTLEGSYTISNNATTSDVLNFGTLGKITNGTTSSVTLTLSGANTGANTIGGVISNGLASTALSKSGAGTWILSGANTFTGGTTIGAGILQMGNRYALNPEADGLGTGGYRDTATTVNVNGGLTFSSGIGTFSLNGLSGTGNIALADVGNKAVTLQLGSVASTAGTNNNSSYLYTGVLSGAGNVAMDYENYEMFSGNNTYTGTTTVAGINYGSYEQGKLFSNLLTSGTPFGTGSIVLNSGVLGIAPGAVQSSGGTPTTVSGNISDTIASGAGGTLTYDGGYLNLTKGSGSNSLTVTIGDSSASATTNVLVRANNGVLVILPATGTAALGTSTGENLFLNGQIPTVANGGIVNGMISPTIISGGPGSTASNVLGVGTRGDFLTYSLTNGFQSAAGSYTNITTPGAVTTTSTEIANFNGGASTMASNNSVYALLIQNGSNLTLGSGVTLSVGDNTAGHQAGIIFNNTNNTGPIGGGTIAFGADEGIIYDGDSGNASNISSNITGTGGLTITGAPQALALNGTNTFSGGLNVQGSSKLNNSSTNASWGDLQNVITLNEGGFTNPGNETAGRSVVLLNGGGDFLVGNQLANYGWNTSGSGLLLTGGGQQVVLSGNNTYTGGTDLTAGETAFSSDANIGGASGAISFVTSQGGNVDLGIMGLYGNGLSNSFGSHPVSFVYSGGGATVSLDIQNVANTFTMTLPLAMGSNGFSKYGPGTLVLNGSESYTGTTTVYGGILQVDEAAGGITGGGALNFNGGTLSIIGNSSGSTTQTFGNVAVSGANGGTTGGGGSALVVNSNGGAGTTVALGTLAQSTVAGSTLLINTYNGGSSGAVVTTTTKYDTTTGNGGSPIGIYGGRVVYEDSTGAYNWATSSGSGPTYTLTGYTNYEALANSSLNTDNVQINGSDTTTIPSYGAVGPIYFNSFDITNTVAGSSLSLDGTANPVILTSGGLLFSGSASYTVGASSADVLEAGTGSNATNTDLIVQQYGTGTLTIAATIANGTGNSTLTKAGFGKLVLTAANTYTGQTYIDGGILSISANNRLGAAATGATVNINGGTLQANTTAGSFGLWNGTTGTNNRAVVFGSNGGTIDVIGGNTFTIAGNLTAFNTGNGAGDGSFTLTSSDNNAGDILNLTGSATGVSEGVTINGGTLETSGAILDGGDFLTFGNSTATVETLMMNNNSATIAGLSAASSNAVIENNTTSGSGVTLTDLQGGDTTYAGTFINGTVASTKTFSLLKAGGGSLTLTNTGSTYTGLTEIDNGILNVASLGTTEGSAGGVASSIGASGNAAANLVFGGAINGTAILQYTGTTGAISTDRLLTIGDLNGTSATLDSSSATAADTMSFTNTGSIAIASTGGTNAADTHNLTLTGSNPGTVTSMNVFAPSLIDGNKPTNLVKSGAGTWVLTNVNPYSGGTTVSGGKLYANGGVAGTSSGLGTGAVTVSAGAAVGGSGVYRPTTAGAGITLQGSASSLISGGIQTSTTAGAGLTLDNRVAGGTILNASTGTANLTFSLGAGNPTGTTAYNFANPNTASTFMTVYGSTSGELSFAAGDTITLTDLTSNLAGGFGAGSTTLQLVLKEPYLLIQAESTAGQHLLTDNNLYSGLMTSGGVVGGVLQNGYVTTPLTIGGTVPAGENALVGFNADRLYLYNGQLEVVPEPGTWALMLGGLTLLVFVQRRRKNDREV